MDIKPKKKSWIGGRVIKTAISVFITSFICLAFNLPAIFAVITAIVTIEPTTHDSIRKGIVRFPASAIGAALAATSVYFLGESALTYTIAATCTIILCQKLKLYEGTLVATLTSVAMIPDLQNYLLLSFLIRLGTTSIGITVSTLVNVLILPADYLDDISYRNRRHIDQIKQALVESLKRLRDGYTPQQQKNDGPYETLNRQLAKTDQLLYFQRKELRYHRFKIKKYRQFSFEKQTTQFIQRAALHLGNLQYIQKAISFTEYEQNILKRAEAEFSFLLNELDKPIDDSYFQFIDDLNNHLQYEFAQSRPLAVHQHTNHDHQLSEKVILFYELLAIHDLIEDLHHHFLKNQPVPVEK
ncbi:FUSC family protein [Salipaludibacillus daqingensis]|uniref:FUSC family protein n=1 Tax=Salipaludibacillus daqingensis TaxID=3041001 RepID=UPI002476DD9B|nr:aromatic acid exporter family protein [Salipaludibacillus daqingensis]